MGKIIYESKGKAQEYGKYGVSAYIGCSNGCKYCYLKTGRFKSVLGGNIPKLKKCFRDEEHAYTIFAEELRKNLGEYQKYGLFITFSSDPMLPKTFRLTRNIAWECVTNKVPIKILSKDADIGNINSIVFNTFYDMFVSNLNECIKYVAFGFTLTGHDELEPKASPNTERINAMKLLHNEGFLTFASIEPIIDFTASMDMIDKSLEFCDLYLIGLKSGQQFDKYSELNLIAFFNTVLKRVQEYNKKVYFKDSLLKAVGIDRKYLPEYCVDKDYNLFNNESRK